MERKQNILSGQLEQFNHGEEMLKESIIFPAEGTYTALVQIRPES